MPTFVTTSIDVGILKNIIMVSYGTLKYVVVEGEWIPSLVKNKSVAKKDPFGFWVVRYASRDGLDHNLYIFPLSVLQVFFMANVIDLDWKVVIEYEPRSKRIIGKRTIIDFGATGSSSSANKENTPAELTMIQNIQQDKLEVKSILVQEIHALDTETNATEDDNHLNIEQYMDEFTNKWV